MIKCSFLLQHSCASNVSVNMGQQLLQALLDNWPKTHLMEMQGKQICGSFTHHHIVPAHNTTTSISVGKISGWENWTTQSLVFTKLFRIRIKIRLKFQTENFQDYFPFSVQENMNCVYMVNVVLDLNA
mgnify:CR=1 FL=1